MMRNATVSAASAAALVILALSLGGCGAGDASVEMAHADFEVESDLWRAIPEAEVVHDSVHGGQGSLYVFTSERVRVPVMDVPVANVEGDSLTVVLWARTEIMQEQVILEMIIEREGEDPRLVQVLLQDVRRTTPWSPAQAAFPILPDETPTRLRLALVINEPGKLWVDDITIWDGAPVPDDGAE